MALKTTRDLKTNLKKLGIKHGRVMRGRRRVVCRDGSVMYEPKAACVIVNRYLTDEEKSRLLALDPYYHISPSSSAEFTLICTNKD